MKVADAIAWLENLPENAEVEITARPIESRPRTGAERAREFRRRKRESVTESNGVSLRGGKGGICEGSEKQAEKKEENGSTLQVDLGASVTKRNAVSLRSKRWRTVPPEWQPNIGHRSLAASRGVDFELELSKFRDHDFATPKLDADRTFRNWLRNAKPERKGAQPFKSAGTLLMERSARIAAEEGEKLPVFPALGGSR